MNFLMKAFGVMLLAVSASCWAAACQPGPGCDQLVFENQTGNSMTLYVDGDRRCEARAHNRCSTFVTTPGRHSLKASGGDGSTSESLEFRQGAMKTWRVFER